MDFFNKAKEAAEKYTGGGDSNKKDDKKDNDSIFSKAMDAVEKYHVKDKAVEYAQKQVAKREEEKHKPGYVENKDKSIVDKAKEAAEDFLAKQGNKPEEVPVVKPVDDKKESRSRSSSSSSSSSSDSEKKCSHSPKSTPVILQQAVPVAPTYPFSVGTSSDYPAYPSNTPSYPNSSQEVDINSSFSRMNMDNNVSSSGKYESYQEYWNRQGNGDDTLSQPRYTGEAAYASDRRQPDNGASTSYSSRVESSSSYYNSEREVPNYASRDNNLSGGDLFGASGSRDSYPSGSASGYYYGRSDGDRNEGRNYASGSDSGRYQTSDEYYRRSGGDRSYDDRTYPSSSDSGHYQSSEGNYARTGGDGRNYPSYSSGAPAISRYDQMGGTYGARGMPGSYGSYGSNDHV